MRFLSYDGILAQVIRYVWGLFLLNVCFVLVSLPIVTIGPAITAVYAFLLDEQQEGNMLGRFFRGLGKNFRQAFVIGLIFLAGAAVLLADWYFLLFYEFAGREILRIVTVVLTVVYLCIASFAFPLQAKFDNPVGVTLKNAVILGLFRPGSSLLMSFVTVFPALLFMTDLDVFVYILSIWLPLGFALQMQVNALIVNRAFRKLQAQPQEAE